VEADDKIHRLLQQPIVRNLKTIECKTGHFRDAALAQVCNDNRNQQTKEFSQQALSSHAVKITFCMSIIGQHAVGMQKRK
jgi:hypothetical protein